jgi:hypothetical protein
LCEGVRGLLIGLLISWFCIKTEALMPLEIQKEICTETKRRGSVQPLFLPMESLHIPDLLVAYMVSRNQIYCAVL